MVRPHFNRFSAALSHFFISALLFSALISILLLFWYPPPFFSASGGWQGLRLVALVDLVLGPTLTLIVFNPKKARKELLTDLLLIGLVQLSALAWGVYALYQQRPVAAVFWQGSFYTVPAKAISESGQNLQMLRQFGSDEPVYVYAQPPESESDHELMLQEIAESRVPPHEHLDRYRPLHEYFPELRRANLNIQEIININQGMREHLDQILEETNSTIHDNYYVSLVSRYRNIVLVFNDDNRIIGMLNAPLKEGPQ